MKQSRQELISKLTEDLSPVKPLGSSWFASSLWLLLSVLLVAAIMLVVQPFRANFVEQLLTIPRFTLEILVGVIAIFLIWAVAMKKAIPGLDSSLLTSGAVIITLLWLSNYLVGLFYPTMEFSMAGKRPHCFWETLVYSLPTLLIGFWIVSKGYVTSWPATGFTLGLAAAFIPGLLMQLACMYGAAHALLTHISPALMVALAGYLLGLGVQRRSMGI